MPDLPTTRRFDWLLYDTIPDGPDEDRPGWLDLGTLRDEKVDSFLTGAVVGWLSAWVAAAVPLVMVLR